MPVTVLNGEAEVRAAVGRHLGASDWITVTQSQLDRFAEATGGDELGFFVLSLSNLFLPEIVVVEGTTMGVNYGTDTVRFPADIGVGSRLRGVAEMVSVSDVKAGLQTLIRITIELEGSSTPACVIDSLSRWYF